MRRLWTAIVNPTLTAVPRPPADRVIIHDPAANRPRNLDDPFLSPRVQARVANVIAASVHKS
jgi:hypothetical protein